MRWERQTSTRWHRSCFLFSRMKAGCGSGHARRSGQSSGRSRPMDGETTAPDVAENGATTAPPVAEDAASAASTPLPVAPRPRSGSIRRVPKPRLTGLLDSPVRNLTFGMIYVVLVMVLATVAYMAVGWSFRDAIYMVVITVYTVGF